MTLSIYLAGPMTGLPDFNRPAFHRAASLLRRAGYHVVNPAELPEPSNPIWQNWMRAGLSAMLTCDAVATLAGAQNSKGATLETMLAVQVGMPVRTVGDWLREGNLSYNEHDLDAPMKHLASQAHWARLAACAAVGPGT